MKFIPLALAALALPSFTFAATESVEFLSKSPLLKKAKLNIAPVEVKDGKVLLQVIWEPKEGGALLGDDGRLHELTYVGDNRTYRTSVDMCGEPHLAPARKAKAGATGRFLVLGKVPEGFAISWHPARAVEKAPPAACRPPKKASALARQESAVIPGLDEEIFFALYDNPAMDMRRKELAGKLDEKCVRETWQVQRVGTSKGGKCTVLLDDPLNCEGTGAFQGSLGKPLGMIVLAQGKESERWLVFQAKGMEGTAFLGVRLTRQRPVKKKDQHFYVFSGC